MGVSSYSVRKSSSTLRRERNWSNNHSAGSSPKRSFCPTLTTVFGHVWIPLRSGRNLRICTAAASRLGRSGMALLKHQKKVYRLLLTTLLVHDDMLEATGPIRWIEPASATGCTEGVQMPQDGFRLRLLPFVY